MPDEKGTKKHTQDSTILEASKRKTLTLKQERFAHAVASGAHQNDAYVDSYNTSAGRDSATVTSNASKVANNPKVKARIAELRAELATAERALETKAVHGGVDLDSEYVLERLRAEVDNPRSTPAARIRALELIGKANGMFSDDINVNVKDEKSSDDVASEIKALVAALSGQKADEVDDQALQDLMKAASKTVGGASAEPSPEEMN